MARVITLDAGVLIAMLDGKDSHHDWATRFLVDHCDADFVMPALTYAECLVRPTQKSAADAFLVSIAGLGLEIVDATAASAMQIALIRATTKLRMPDAVVVATSVMKGSALATTDQTLAKAAAQQSLAVFVP